MGRLTVKGVDAALRKAMGNRAAVGREFGVTRQAVMAMIGRHPQLQATVDEIEQTMLDNAETVFYKKVLDGDFAAVKWYLATKGKARGYVERQEVIGTMEQHVIYELDEDSRRAIEAAERLLTEST